MIYKQGSNISTNVCSTLKRVVLPHSHLNGYIFVIHKCKSALYSIIIYTWKGALNSFYLLQQLQFRISSEKFRTFISAVLDQTYVPMKIAVSEV